MRSWISLRNSPSDPSTARDRKSTRLNSSHLVISYAVFCLKKKIFAYSRAIFSDYHAAQDVVQETAIIAFRNLKHLFPFFFNDTATTEIYTLSLHDALPISP